MHNCKKKKMASYKKHTGTKLDQFQPRVLEILSLITFRLFLELTPGGHLG